jgi:hypothetical protein
MNSTEAMKMLLEIDMYSDGQLIEAAEIVLAAPKAPHLDRHRARLIMQVVRGCDWEKDATGKMLEP